MAKMDPVESNLRATTSREVGQPDWLDHVEARLFALGGQPQSRDGEAEGCPLTHRFLPGLYVREITMPAGTVAVTKIHRTEHPFVISQGSCWVYSEAGGWQHLVAPFTGVTKPGTRRFVYTESDTVWTTFHPTNSTDLDEIEAAIIEPHSNPLIVTEPLSSLAQGSVV